MINIIININININTLFSIFIHTFISTHEVRLRNRVLVDLKSL